MKGGPPVPPDPEVAAQLDATAGALTELGAVIEAAEVARSAATVHLAALALALDADVEPPPPPGPVYPKPDAVVVAPLDRALAVSIEHPDTIPPEYSYMVVAWGTANTFVGSKTAPPPFPAAYMITGLTNGTLYNVEVGYGVGRTGVPTEAKVTGTGIPVGSGKPDPPPLDSSWPGTGSWAEKEAWIIGRAGTEGALHQVNSAATAAATGLPIAWSDSWGGVLVNGPCRLADLDIAGQVVLTGGAGHAVELDNVACRGLWSTGGHATLVSRVTVTHRPHNLGQGALNALSSDTVVTRCDLSGFGDGIQHSGRLTVTETWFHDAAYSSTTHNDDIQGYPGSSLRVERCVFDHVPPRANARNGLIFTDGPSPAGGDVVDSILRCAGPYGGANWVANGYMGPFRFLRSRILGRTVRDNITFTDCEYT